MMSRETRASSVTLSSPCMRPFRRRGQRFLDLFDADLAHEQGGDVGHRTVSTGTR